jgi:hypothetical protein
VQRGKWVLENLLGTPPPPPPPNVPPLDPHGRDGKLSMRQAMEMHRANPVCATCHSRMDPIGFALENFNAIGEWRDKDNGTLIDPSGKLPDGSEFKGSAGLEALLLTQHRDEFISTFTEKLMIYALGRGLESYDRPAVRSIMRDAAKAQGPPDAAPKNGGTHPSSRDSAATTCACSSRDNYDIQALIRAIIDSPQFQMRRTKES